MIEYRVRPVTRYVVTRFEHPNDNTRPPSLKERGEYANAEVAHEVAYALCKAEHDAAGTALDDPDFKYPNTDDLVQAQRDHHRGTQRQDSQLSGQRANDLRDGSYPDKAVCQRQF